MSERAAPTISLAIDSRDPAALAPFWAAALDYEPAGSEGAYTVLVPRGRPGPNLLLQRVPEEKSGKNRVHIDVKVPDVEATVARLQGLGASRASEVRSELGSTWIVMADPEGNEFCVCDGGGSC